jgi:hypothetical protein
MIRCFYHKAETVIIFIEVYNIHVDSLQRRPWNRLCEVSVAGVVSCMFFSVCVCWLMIKNVPFICSAVLVIVYSRFLSIRCSFCLFESRSAECLSLYITHSKTFLL